MKINKIVKFAKKKLLPALSLSFFEVFIIVIVLLTTLGYILFLKTATKESVIFVETSIQKADWWRTDTLIPTKLLKSLKTGSTDQSHRLKITHIRYFIGELKDWEHSDDRSMGVIQFEVESDRQNQKLFYKNQELLVGNPINVEVNQAKLELLITKIQETPFLNEFKHRKVLVKLYERREEMVSHFKKGIELKDNNGFVYGKIISVNKEYSPKTTTDQWGNVMLRKDPKLFDIIVELDLLTTQEGERNVNYDGSPVAVGKPFEFNHPLLDSTNALIIDIQ